MADREYVIIGDPGIDVPATSLTLEARFAIGDRVYHLVGDGNPGMVTGYLVRTTGLVYQVTWGESLGETGHFGFELSSEKPL